MRRTVAAVALAVLLALSGCSVLGGGTPTATADLSAENAPPGVSAESETLEDHSALLDAHTATLVETGFTYELRTNATVVGQQGETRRVRRQQVTAVSPGVEEYAYTTVNPGSRFDVWGNESVQAVKFQFGDQVRYRTGEPTAAASLSGQNVFARYLANGEWTVTNVTEREGSTTLVTLESSTPPEQAGAVPRNATDVRDYEARMVVDEDGRVYEFEAGGAYTIDGEEGTFSIQYTLRGLEDPGVARPDWLSEAFS